MIGALMFEFSYFKMSVCCLSVHLSCLCQSVCLSVRLSESQSSSAVDDAKGSMVVTLEYMFS